MLTLADVSKSYGPRTLFGGVSLFVSRTDRYGLVGPNGAGKTTLFNLILGEESPDEGTITWERGADFGFLSQESAPAGDETILQIATGRTGISPAPGADHDVDYTLEPRAKKILAGLGFRETDHERRADSFSGGWVMRAHLARLLVAEPALLLLDEPTNHLDLEALLWFQDYLTRYPGGLLVISHDRAFLNTLCTGILELRGGTLNRYTGNYDDFIEEKENRHAQQLARFKNQQREIAHLQRFVDRFGAKATLASRAKSKEKQIERLQEAAVDEPEEDLRRVNFKFPQPPRSGRKVITLEHVQQAYGDHVVYRDLNFTAERGQRIVLVGPNGAGKSTLLKILAGIVPLQAGVREPGSNIIPGYFAQNRLDNLDPRHTVLLPIEARGAISACAQPTAGVFDATFSNHRISFGAVAPAPTMVVVSQTWYPAWKARIDGIPAKVWRANYAFQALEVPAGRHRIELAYEDRMLRLGALLSACGLLSCGGLLCVVARLQQPQPAVPAGAE